MRTTCGAAPRWCPGAPDRVLRKQVLLECFLPLGRGGPARSPCSLLPSGRAQLRARPAGWKPAATGHDNAGLSWDRPHSAAGPGPGSGLTGAELSRPLASAGKKVVEVFNLESYRQLCSRRVVPACSVASGEGQERFPCTFYTPGVFSVVFLLSSPIEQDGLSQEEGPSYASSFGRSLWWLHW